MKNFETEIEGLRGFAAFTVALWHIVYFKYALDPNFALHGPLVEVNFAHNSVLLFFILSGYVIGLTNKNTFSLDIALTYLKKRWVRLYPLYFFAIVFAVAVMPIDNLTTITGNLFFLQYLVTDTIKANSVLWTLNYEAIYYLLFLLILAIRPNLWILAITVFVLSAFIIVYHQLPIKISDYATGWFFWLSGPDSCLEIGLYQPPQPWWFYIKPSYFISCHFFYRARSFFLWSIALVR
ncbi:MAG: acyltransferase family protein [Bacteroidetes bacterium]|nr:acyltransferase family protein [Bacteroidota bacterium]